MGGEKLNPFDTSVEASEPHDFAVRLGAVRLRHHGRPSHPAPTSVTIAKRPSAGRDAAHMLLICAREEAEYFFRQGWTGQIRLKRLGKLRFARMSNADRFCLNQAATLGPDVASLIRATRALVSDYVFQKVRRALPAHVFQRRHDGGRLPVQFFETSQQSSQMHRQFRSVCFH